MTTKVTISSPDINHEDILVSLANPQTGEIYEGYRLSDGDSIEVYIHDTRSLIIQEIPKSLTMEVLREEYQTVIYDKRLKQYGINK